MDDASSNGLFNHFVSGDTVPVLCIDEAHSFLMKITSFSKSPQANLTLERLCKCFDGDCWYVLKGNKGKRTGIPSSRASLLAFTTPKQFLQTVWPKMLSAENGFAERVLLFYQRKEEKDLEVMAQHSGALEDFPIQSLMECWSKSMLNITTIFQLSTPLLPLHGRHFLSLPSHKIICLTLKEPPLMSKPMSTTPSEISMYCAWRSTCMFCMTVLKKHWNFKQAQQAIVLA